MSQPVNSLRGHQLLFSAAQCSRAEGHRHLAHCYLLLKSLCLHPHLHDLDTSVSRFLCFVLLKPISLHQGRKKSKEYIILTMPEIYSACHVHVVSLLSSLLYLSSLVMISTCSIHSKVSLHQETTYTYIKPWVCNRQPVGHNLACQAI